MTNLVDVTLIDATLALTVEERLRQNDRMLLAIEELRAAVADLGLPKPVQVDEMGPVASKTT